MVKKILSKLSFPGKVLAILSISLSIVSCKSPNRDTYNFDEVGKTTAVTFGTIIKARSIGIIGKNTGIGAGVAGAAGAGGGAYVGNKSGTLWAIGGGALAGAAIGYLIEQGFANREGVEYTVVLENGVVITAVQELSKNEGPLAINTRVIVQNTGGFQRVLSAEDLPTEIKRPQGIKIND
jgi:outer membrane lipoprotein SlyB